MTRKRTEPDFMGRNTWAPSGAAARAMARIAAPNRDRMPVASGRDRVRHHVEDDVRLDVAKHEIVLDDAVLELLRQGRQQRQKRRGKRRQRVGRGIQHVHRWDEGGKLLLLVLSGLLY